MRSGHQTQWAAQFAVASELCIRGYEVALTSGHTTPVADLMAVSPIENEMFLVDVKGLYQKIRGSLNESRYGQSYFIFLPTYRPMNHTNSS